MRTHINEVRQAIHGIIQPPQVSAWLTVYASPDAGEDEMIHVLIEKMLQIIDDSPSCSPFWGRHAHESLQKLCRGTWWRRIVAGRIIARIIREGIKDGSIITNPGSMMGEQQTYTLSSQGVKAKA